MALRTPGTTGSTAAPSSHAALRAPSSTSHAAASSGATRPSLRSGENTAPGGRNQEQPPAYPTFNQLAITLCDEYEKAGLLDAGLAKYLREVVQLLPLLDTGERNDLIMWLASLSPALKTSPGTVEALISTRDKLALVADKAAGHDPHRAIPALLDLICTAAPSYATEPNASAEEVDVKTKISAFGVALSQEMQRRYAQPQLRVRPASSAPASPEICAAEAGLISGGYLPITFIGGEGKPLDLNGLDPLMLQMMGISLEMPGADPRAAEQPQPAEPVAQPKH